MTSFKKLFKGLKNEHILGIVGLIFLVFALYQYSNNKNLFQVGMTSNIDMSPEPTKVIDNEVPAKVDGASQENSYASFNNIPEQISNSINDVTNMNKPATNPMDLLPNDENSIWNSMNPATDMKSVTLLNPEKLVGQNTQGSSLRNANLQVRSEPPNPRTNTNCPWNISTIESDTFRKPLEIGSGV